MEFNIKVNITKQLVCCSFYACMIQRIFDEVQRHATLIRISRSVKPNDKKWQQRIHCCKLIEHKLCHTIVVHCDPKHKKMVLISIVTCAKGKVIYTKYSKQFKWHSYFYVSGQSRPFWAVLKLLQIWNLDT
jgi:hypothetical protein